MGILDTAKLVSMLGIMEEDIELTLTKSNEKALALKIKDSTADVHFMLTDTTVIEKAPGLNSTPEFSLKLELDTEFMKKFVAAKSALADTKAFTVITTGSTADLVIGYSSINTNRVTLPAKVAEHKDIEKLSFNADLFKDVIQANSQCPKALLEISEAGIAKIEFEVDGYHSRYYFVAIENAG